MNLAFQLLLLSHVRMNIMMFVICGFFTYMLDYRNLKKDASYQREAAITKMTSYVFIFGGIGLLVIYQLLMIMT